MHIAIIVLLMILSSTLLALNVSAFIFNGSSNAFKYYSYSNPYMTILEMIYANNNVEYEKEVYAKVAIEYICNDKCKDGNCIINGTSYRYNEVNCQKARLFETIISDYGYYNISIVSIISLSLNCLTILCLICELLYKCFIMKNNKTKIM